MGFWDSFTGQVGRDTGRAVSNAIWKDKHAIMHSEVNNREFKQRKILREWDRQDTIEDRIQLLSVIEISDDKNELLSMLAQLTILLKSNSYKDATDNNKENENKLRNTYTDAILAKYEQVFMLYSARYPDDSMISYYGSILKSVKRSKFIKKYGALTIALSVMIIPILIGLIVSAFS